MDLRDSPDEAAFRETLRGWLRDNLPKGWMDAIESGDDEEFGAVRKDWNVFSWNGQIGTSGYAAPLWPKCSAAALELE